MNQFQYDVKKSLFTFAKKMNSLVSPAFPRLNAKRPGSLVDLAKNFCLPWFECQSARHKGKNFEEHVRWRHKSCKVNTLRLRIFVSFNCSEIFVIDLIWSEIPLYILCLIAVLLLNQSEKAFRPFKRSPSLNWHNVCNIYMCSVSIVSNNNLVNYHWSNWYHGMYCLIMR